MSISIEQMIIDAKRLANRLKEKEALADALTNDTERINYQIESMRQFQDDVNALNILAREKSNNDMITTIHQENPQIREMQQENRQLKVSIEEHQRAIELIMSKYRQHTQHQIQDTKLNFDRMAKKHNNSNCVNLISNQAKLFQEAVSVIQSVIKIEDDDSNQYMERLSQLQTENQGLRELLGIANSMNSTLIHNIGSEKSTQTDNANSTDD